MDLRTLANQPALSGRCHATEPLKIRRIIEIIETGTAPERKAMCETLLAELRIDGQTATPVIRVPLSQGDARRSFKQKREPQLHSGSRLPAYGGAGAAPCSPDDHHCRHTSA